jgi:hypothetical protein
MATVTGGQGNIVTNGLVLNLDAANPRSYAPPFNGTTWQNVALVSSSLTGSLVNGPIFSTSGSGCIVFDGTNDYTNLGNMPYNRTTFSVFAWANFPTFHVNWKSGIITKWFTGGGTGVDNEWFLGVNNIGGPSPFACTVQYSLGSSAYVSISDSVNYVTNTWYHVGFTWNSGTLSLYKNGNFITSSSTVNTSAQTTTQPIYVANFYDAVNYPSNVRVGSTQMYNRALSTSEVLQNFNATRARFGI